MPATRYAYIVVEKMGKGCIRNNSRRRCRNHGVDTGLDHPSSFAARRMRLPVCPGRAEASLLRDVWGSETWPVDDRDGESRQVGQGGLVLASYQASLRPVSYSFAMSPLTLSMFTAASFGLLRGYASDQWMSSTTPLQNRLVGVLGMLAGKT
jgi:hypothetical protein